MIPVSIWVVDSTSAPLEMAGAAKWMSAADRVRAAAFRTDDARRVFVLGRALLRTALAHALHDGSPVELVTSSSGKPMAPAFPTVSFNLTHCEGMIAVALTEGVAIGIDAEPTSSAGRIQGVVDQIATSAEMMRMESSGLAQAVQLWTLKECLAKCDGAGFALPFNHYEFLGLGTERPRLVETTNDPRHFVFRTALMGKYVLSACVLQPHRSDEDDISFAWHYCAQTSLLTSERPRK